jgi:hypothetical protein
VESLDHVARSLNDNDTDFSKVDPGPLMSAFGANRASRNIPCPIAIRVKADIEQPHSASSFYKHALALCGLDEPDARWAPKPRLVGWLR